MALIVVIVEWTIRIAAIIVIPRNRRPTAAMAWLLAIFFIPEVGILLYLVIGNPRLPRKRRLRQTEINDYIRDASRGADFGRPQPDAPPEFDAMVQLNRNLGAMPLTSGNRAQLLSDYQASIQAMTDAIAQAKDYVHVEFYILQFDRSTEGFFQALDDARQRGVTVRVLMDHWANRGKPFYRQTVARLDAMGASWHLMLPLQLFRGKFQRPDLRNHRKLLVVDGRVAFTGSQNITDSTYNLKANLRRGLHWVDLMVRVEGPIVASVNAVFLSDWYSETDEVLSGEIELPHDHDQHRGFDGQIVPSGPGFEFQNNLKLFMSMLFAARERIIIVSPYFIPDEGLMVAITTACQRGVEVELFVSEEGDQAMVYHAQRSYYEALLRAGVKIWMYQKPFILHSKSMTIDDEIAIVGSSNMDMRSFGLNMEISMLVRGPDFVRQLRQVEHEYRTSSRELTAEEWKQQPLRSTVLDNLARLTSALQ